MNKRLTTTYDSVEVWILVVGALITIFMLVLCYVRRMYMLIVV